MKHVTLILTITLSTLGCQKDKSPVSPTPTPTPNPKYYFGPAFKVGMSWHFKHTSFDRDPAMCRFDERSGMHQWTIASVSVSSGDTIYVVNLTKQDTVHEWQTTCYPGQTPYDTTYAVNESVQFNILISKDTAAFNWPSLYREGAVYIPDAHRMPRGFSAPPPDSILVGWDGVTGGPYAAYTDYARYRITVGPALFYVFGGGNHTHGETLSLTTFIDPG